MYKIIFTQKALKDLSWFTSYYIRIFPEGQVGAYANFQKCLDTISEFPEIGRLDSENDNREFIISKTRFTIIYCIQGENIYIQSVWDDRRNPISKKNQ